MRDVYCYRVISLGGRNSRPFARLRPRARESMRKSRRPSLHPTAPDSPIQVAPTHNQQHFFFFFNNKNGNKIKYDEEAEEVRPCRRGCCSGGPRGSGGGSCRTRHPEGPPDIGGHHNNLPQDIHPKISSSKHTRSQDNPLPPTLH
jgi:hypothetical protein